MKHQCLCIIINEHTDIVRVGRDGHIGTAIAKASYEKKKTVIFTSSTSVVFCIPYCQAVEHLLDRELGLRLAVFSAG